MEVITATKAKAVDQMTCVFVNLLFVYQQERITPWEDRNRQILDRCCVDESSLTAFYHLKDSFLPSHEVIYCLLGERWQRGSVCYVNKIHLANRKLATCYYLKARMLRRDKRIQDEHIRQLQVRNN